MMNRGKWLPLLILAFSAIQLKSQILLSPDKVVLHNEVNINTEYLEFSPAFFKDGIIYVTTQYRTLDYKILDRRIDRNMMSIFQANFNTEGILEIPRPMPNILNSKLHEGPVSFDLQGGTMYFTRNDPNRLHKRKVNDNLIKLKVYSATFNDGSWSDLQELPFNDKETNTCHPSLAPEGNVLYFASDREGGYGGMDLYRVEMQADSSWGDPVNLGPTVNTSSDEVFPFIHADGTLYFSSDRDGGFGGLDLYYTNEAGGWVLPINLGPPFNTDYDDFGLIVDLQNKGGYFSSNRPGGKGEDDIYGFKILTGGDDRAGRMQRQVVVIDAATGQPIEGAAVTYMNLNDIILGQPLSSAQEPKGIIRLQSVSNDRNELSFKMDIGEEGNGGLTNDKGQHLVFLDRSGKYIVKTVKDGYQPVQIAFAADQLPNGPITISLEKAVDCIAFKGQVANKSFQTSQAGATVVIRDLDSGEEFKVVTDASGNFEHCLKCDRSYLVFAEKNGVKGEVETITTKGRPCTGDLKLDKTLDLSGLSPLAENMIIELPNIFYNFDDASIRPDARGELDKVVEMMRLYPGMSIEFAAHTDSRGSRSYNLDLSQRRANNAVAYMEGQGVDAGRIRPMGYGESQLRNRCRDGVACSEEEHQYNRRTEVKIIKFDNVLIGGASPLPDNLFEANNSTTVISSGVTTDKTPQYAQESPAASGEVSVVPVSIQAGEFYVVAGTFSSTTNAQKRLEELRNLGYEAQIMTFDASPYQAVCAGRFEDDASAKSFVKSLKEKHQIKSYVKRL